jgi:hypothetical protein
VLGIIRIMSQYVAIDLHHVKPWPRRPSGHIPRMLTFDPIILDLAWAGARPGREAAERNAVLRAMLAAPAAPAQDVTAPIASPRIKA